MATETGMRMTSPPRARAGWHCQKFYMFIDCRWLPFLTFCRDLHSNLAAIAVMFRPNSSVAHGMASSRRGSPDAVIRRSKGVLRVRLAMPRRVIRTLFSILYMDHHG
jgi:hypothetical protein